LWVLILVVVLIAASLMFGGFVKGTKANGLGRFCTSCTAAPIAAVQWRAEAPL
jgi:hypothetical protein